MNLGTEPLTSHNTCTIILLIHLCAATLNLKSSFCHSEPPPHLARSTESQLQYSAHNSPFCSDSEARHHLPGMWPAPAAVAQPREAPSSCEREKKRQSLYTQPAASASSPPPSLLSCEVIQCSGSLHLHHHHHYKHHNVYNPFSTGTHFHIHSSYYLLILYGFRNVCGD